MFNQHQFATFFMFIPHQDDGGNDKSDFDCTNDKYGCWTPSHAVVDHTFTAHSMKTSHDYAFLSVPNVGSHAGPGGVNASLEKAVPAMGVSFERPTFGRSSYSLGYTIESDTTEKPSDLRYCKRTLTVENERGGIMLNGCGIGPGSSGGP